MIEQHEHAGDFLELTRKISLERGFGCASYKEKCLRRRIAVRMRARGVHTYGDYARVLDADAQRVRPPARRADDQRHQALSELGSLRVDRGERRADAVASADCREFASGAPDARPATSRIRSPSCSIDLRR